uniref:protein-tyrosine-phosphatase n=1 Tax=Anopheles braziliensis TaxID=58242 RepID=A0A2M3ZJY2_9DIPT
MSHRKRRLRNDVPADEATSSLLAVTATPSFSAEQPKDTMEEPGGGGGDDTSGFTVDDDDGSLEPSIPLPPVPSGRGNGGNKAAACSSSGSNGRSNGGGGSGASSLSREIGQVDILGIVCNLRLQRGGMVQNSEQYELIHRALCLYLEKLTQEKRSAQGDSGGLGGRSST